MNTNKLKALVSKNETAARIFDLIVARQRNTVYTAFSGLRADLKKKDGVEINREEFDGVFADLAGIGAGKVDKSPRGIFKGFTWSIPIRSLANALQTPVENSSEEIVAEKKAISAAQSHRAGKKDKKVTLVIIRKNRKPETVELSEEAMAQFKSVGLAANA